MKKQEDIDRLNDESIGRAHRRWLETPAEKEPCKVCGGTGYVIGTETEMTYGDYCHNGCPHNIHKGK